MGAKTSKMGFEHRHPESNSLAWIEVVTTRPSGPCNRLSNSQSCLNEEHYLGVRAIEIT